MARHLAGRSAVAWYSIIHTQEYDPEVSLNAYLMRPQAMPELMADARLLDDHGAG